MELSKGTGPWTEIAQVASWGYLDAPPCGPVAYRVRAHWHGLSLWSEYGAVVTLRACASAAPTNLSVFPWQGTYYWLGWADQSSDESDFHIERQVEWGEWAEIAQVGANAASYVDTSAPCGVVAYRVSAHRHNSGQFSEYTNVASGSRACLATVAGVVPTLGGPGGGTSDGGSLNPARLAGWAGLLLLIWGAWLGARRWGRPFGPLGAARRGAQVALALIALLLLPAAALAQSGQVEFYHLDARPSTRASALERGSGRP